MIDDRNFFDKPIRNNIKTYENIFKKLLQVKEMITRLAFCQIVLISNKIMK